MSQERVPIAIIGLNWGMMMIKQLQSPRNQPLFEVAGVCALHFDKAQRIGTEVGAKPYHDLDEILADPRIRAVGLFVGPEGRADMVRKIIRAGKDLITTKPFETDPDRALDVLQEARKLGRVIHLNSPHPTLAPDLVQIKKWEQQYDLGRVVGVRADQWAPYFEQADGSWYDDPKQAPGAPIFRLGIYLLNDIIQVIGMPDLVYLIQTRIRTGRPTSDNAQLSMRFPNGCIGNLYVSLCVGDGELRKTALIINYERGTIYRNVGPTETPGSRDLVQLAISAIPEGQQRILEHAEVPGGSGTYNWSLFHRAVTGEKLQNEVTPEEIVAGLRVVKAMARSEVTGQPEQVQTAPLLA